MQGIEKLEFGNGHGHALLLPWYRYEVAGETVAIWVEFWVQEFIDICFIPVGFIEVFVGFVVRVWTCGLVIWALRRLKFRLGPMRICLVNRI